jgi:hypothetical protein
MMVFPFKPLQAGYTVDFTDGLISIDLDGGLPRTRLDVQGSPRPVSATWVLVGDEYDLFMGYIRNWIRSGGASLQMSLMLDSSKMEDYETIIVARSIKLAAKNGKTFTVTASLLVLPLDRYLDEETDEYGIVAQWVNDTYGDPFVAGEVLNLLDRLVNVSLPHE